MTLISLPSALFAIYAFNAEIIDYITEPDISIELREISIRCNENRSRLGQNGDKPIEELCPEWPLSISLGYHIESSDSIIRYFKGIRIETSLPTLGEIKYSFALDIDHQILNGYDYVVKKTWFVKQIPPGYVATHEVEFLPDPTRKDSSELEFKKFQNSLLNNQEQFTQSTHYVAIYGSFDDGDEVLLGKCHYRINEKAILDFIGKALTPQITGYCEKASST